MVVVEFPQLKERNFLTFLATEGGISRDASVRRPSIPSKHNKERTMTSSQKSPITYVETNEQKRLNEARETGVPWKKWGPYLSERQWGTVREDYSSDGNAWNYFSHDQARSRAYRWGEDGLAGISDDKQ